MAVSLTILALIGAILSGVPASQAAPQSGTPRTYGFTLACLAENHRDRLAAILVGELQEDRLTGPLEAALRAAAAREGIPPSKVDADLQEAASSGSALRMTAADFEKCKRDFGFPASATE